MNNQIVVIDFETTGLSPKNSRIIEVAALIVDNHTNAVIDSFTQLMNPDQHISKEITSITGITNEMVAGQPYPENVMRKLKMFIGDRRCVAHNAAFDSKFYFAEMDRAGMSHARDFLCTLKLARGLISDSANHKLGTLVEHLKLEKPEDGEFHRALYDATMTTKLWARLKNMVKANLLASKGS
jgi:DNA polymerase-3 subunit epsilon